MTGGGPRRRSAGPGAALLAGPGVMKCPACAECAAHRGNRVVTWTYEDGRTRGVLVCDECARGLIESGEWREDDEEGIVRVDERST